MLRVLGEVSVVCLLAIVVKGSLGVVRLAVADISAFEVVASAFFPACITGAAYLISGSKASA